MDFNDFNSGSICFGLARLMIYFKNNIKNNIWVEVIIELRQKLHLAIERLEQMEEVLSSDAFEEFRQKIEKATPDMNALIPSIGAKLMKLKRDK